MKTHHMVALATLVVPALCLAQTFDYVIVGAGTCGLLLANRLSQDAQTTVALIDPGADERNNSLVSDPARFTQIFLSRALDWAYSSLPQPGAANRALTSHAGKGIGGSSLINGMTYIRGDKAQFDAWEELGNQGWNWNLFLRYFKKLERFFPPEPRQAALGASFMPESHGYRGDLHVGFIPDMQNDSFYRHAKTSWAKLGQDVNRDVDSGATRGFDVYPQTLDPRQNRRWDAATAYFWPVARRPNLHLLNGTATRVLWKSGDVNAEAEGVEYLTSNKERRVICAKREVILSAGALRTPLILERSGIGRTQLLRKRGIKPVVDSRGVGENLMEQPNLSLIYQGKRTFDGASPFATFVSARDIFGDSVDEVASRSWNALGQRAQQVLQSNGRERDEARALEHIFRVQHGLVFSNKTTVAEILTSAFGDKLLSTFWALLPFSRGSVHVGPSGELDEPAIDTQLLTADLDMEIQVAAGRLAAQFWSTEPVNELVAGSIAPNASDSLPLPPKGRATDEQWRRWTRRAVETNSHPIGTAAMMARELGGVVDPSLAVYGAARLRVVDASVLPLQMSGHLTATLYAVAERAAELIKAEKRW